MSAAAVTAEEDRTWVLTNARSEATRREVKESRLCCLVRGEAPTRSAAVTLAAADENDRESGCWLVPLLLRAAVDATGGRERRRLGFAAATDVEEAEQLMKLSQSKSERRGADGISFCVPVDVSVAVVAENEVAPIVWIRLSPTLAIFFAGE